jgi:hypothetical protein
MSFGNDACIYRSAIIPKSSLSLKTLFSSLFINYQCFWLIIICQKKRKVDECLIFDVLGGWKKVVFCSKGVHGNEKREHGNAKRKPVFTFRKPVFDFREAVFDFREAFLIKREYVLHFRVHVFHFREAVLLFREPVL